MKHRYDDDFDASSRDRAPRARRAPRQDQGQPWGAAPAEPNGNNAADKELTCSDCKVQFLFTEGEQAFYASKNFQPPKRCKGCRAAHKAQRDARSGQ